MPDMDNSNPWRTISVKEIYNNAWIRLTHREVINPSGNNGIYGVVHFHNIALGILPLDENHNTWLVGQYRYPLEEYSWEIPEGGGLIGIDPLESAKRELKEEVGLEANKWTFLLKTHISNSVTDEYGLIYIAQDLTEGVATPEETEQLTVQKMPFQKALDWVMDGKITDSLSVAAILKTRILMDRGKI